MEVRDLDASHARRRESDGVRSSGWEGDTSEVWKKNKTKIHIAMSGVLISWACPTTNCVNEKIMINGRLRLHSSGRWLPLRRNTAFHTLTRTLGDPPLRHVAGGLEEAGVVVLLQALLGLRDEGAGALQTLAAVCDLLRQLAQLHHLGKK